MLLDSVYISGQLTLVKLVILKVALITHVTYFDLALAFSMLLYTRFVYWFCPLFE